MDKNLDNIAKDLFGKIRTQFQNLRLGDEKGAVTDTPSNARFFKFEFKKNGINLGSITVNLSDKDGMVVMYSNDVTDDQTNSLKTHWYKFLRELKQFAKENLMKFDIRNLTKSNLTQRDYKVISKEHGESGMSESKLWGTSKTSYQKIGEALIIVKHSAPINTSRPASRASNVNKIYIENIEGERFKYPYKHLNGARALAMHVSHGGNNYDNIGKHIISLSEELGKLRKYKNYVGRNPAISESMDDVNVKVVKRIDEVKKQIQSLQSANYYSKFVESYVDSDTDDIPEDVVNEWIDKLTIKTFNEELKDVFPYIYKLSNSITELVAEDLVSEMFGKEKTGEDIRHELSNMDNSDYYNILRHQKGSHEYDILFPIYKKIRREHPDAEHNEIFDLMHGELTGMSEFNEVSEMVQFESLMNSIVEDQDEPKDALFSDGPEQEAAIKQLNILLANPIMLDADGTNAKESLKGIIDNDDLETAFKDWSQINPETDARWFIKEFIESHDSLNNSDIASKLDFSKMGEKPEQEEEPAPEQAPAEAPPAEEQAPPEQQPEQGQQPTPEAPNELPPMNASVQHKGYSLVEGVKSDYEKVVEYVNSMYDSNAGAFPKGETGVLISCEKEFGPKSVRVAKKVIGELHQVNEMNRIRHLAGIKEAKLGYTDGKRLQANDPRAAQKPNTYTPGEDPHPKSPEEITRDDQLNKNTQQNPTTQQTNVKKPSVLGQQRPH